MKLYWMTLGAGTLVAVVGGVMWTMSSGANGLVLILGGLVVAVMGGVMALIQKAVEKSK